MIFRSTSVPNIGANHDSSSQGADGNGPRLTRATSLLDERQMQRIIEDNLVAKQQTPDSFSLGPTPLPSDNESHDADSETDSDKETGQGKAQAKKKVEKAYSGKFSPERKAKIHLGLMVPGGILALALVPFCPVAGVAIAAYMNTILCGIHGGKVFNLGDQPENKSKDEKTNEDKPEENTSESPKPKDPTKAEPEPTPNIDPDKKDDEPEADKAKRERENDSRGSVIINNTYNIAGDTYNIGGDTYNIRDIYHGDVYVDERDGSPLGDTSTGGAENRNLRLVSVSTVTDKDLSDKVKKEFGTPSDSTHPKTMLKATVTDDINELDVYIRPDGNLRKLIQKATANTGTVNGASDNDAQTDETKTPSGALGWVKKGDSWEATKDFAPTQTPEGPYRGKNYEADRNGGEALHNAPFIKPAVGKTAGNTTSSRDGASETAKSQTPEQLKGDKSGQAEIAIPSNPSATTTGTADTDSVASTPEDQSADPSAVNPQSLGAGDNQPATDNDAQTDKTKTPSGALGWVKKGDNWEATKDFAPTQTPEGPYRGKNYEADRNGGEALHNAPFIKPAVGKTAGHPTSSRDGASETAKSQTPEQLKGDKSGEAEIAVPSNPSVTTTGTADKDSVLPTPEGQSADPSAVNPQSLGAGDNQPATDNDALTVKTQTPNNTTQGGIPSKLSKSATPKDREFSAEVGSEIVGNTHFNEVKIQVGDGKANKPADAVVTEHVNESVESNVTTTHISFIKKDVNISSELEPELQSVSASNHADNLVQDTGVSDKSGNPHTLISRAHIDIKMPIDTSKPNRIVSNTYSGRLERQRINGQTKWVLTNPEGERGNKTVVLSHGSSVSAMARNYTKETRNGEPLFHNVVDIDESKLRHVESIKGFLVNTNETYKSFFDRHLTSPRRDENLKWVS